MSKPDEPDLSHYKTTGLGLALVGFINSAIATYSLVQGSENSFIEYEVMLAFGISFIMIGYWMRSLD
jgi:hypothetical protein